jgi:TatD family-associated radical SAM protein
MDGSFGFPMTILYEYGDALYCNLTNRCPCDCAFCLRQVSEGVAQGESLWLEREPTLDDIRAGINAVGLGRYSEFVFCGYGEPTERLDALLYTAGLVKNKSSLPIRLNTNGLSDLINNKKTAPLLEKWIDRVSVSLNAPDAETYRVLCKPAFGLPSYGVLIDFALACKGYAHLDVCFSVVGRALSDKQLNECRVLCEGLGVRLRVR